MPIPGSDDDVLEQLLARCFEELHAGRTLDLDAVCRIRPSLRARLEVALARQDEFAEVLGKQDDAGSTAVGRLAAGTRLGDFRIESFLGAGGMGEVYAAEQVSLGRRVALKVLSGTDRFDGNARLRFQREASITAALNHPNIVPVYATGASDGVDYLAMSLVEGQGLDELGQLEPRRAVGYAIQIARALQAAHEVGVVHRDVKPANVMIGRDRALLLDFGLARADSAATLTRADAAPGTLPYMAPERLSRTGLVADPRSDVYSLGATLYEVLSGRAPFASDPPASAVQRVLRDDPPPLPKHVRRDLAVIVARAMDKEPTRRFQSASEFADDLERFLADEPILSRPSGIVRRTVKLARRHPVFSTAAVLLVAAGTVLGALLSSHAAEREAEFGRQEQSFRQALHANRFEDAGAVLDALRASHRGDDRLEELAHERFASRVLTMMLISLPVPRAVLERDELVMSQVAEDPVVGRDPRIEFVGALLAHQRGAIPDAKTRCQRFADAGAYPRSAAALAAFLDGRSVEDAVHGVAAAQAPAAQLEDHLLTAAVGRIARSSLAFREAEVLAAEDLDPQSIRARLLLVGILEERGELRAAYEVQRGIGQVDSFLGLVPVGLAELSGRLAMRARSAAGSAADTDETTRRWVDRGRAQLAEAEHAIGPANPEALSMLDLSRWTLDVAAGDLDGFWDRWRARSDLAPTEGYWMLAYYAARLAGPNMASLEWLRNAESVAADDIRRVPLRRLALSAECQALFAEVGSSIPVRDPEKIARLREIAHSAAELAQSARRLGLREDQGMAMTIIAGVHEVLGETHLAVPAAQRACSVWFSPPMVLVFVRPLAGTISWRTETAPREPPIVEPTHIQMLDLAWYWVARSLDEPQQVPFDVPTMNWARFWLAYERDDSPAMLESASRALDAPNLRAFDRDFIGTVIESGLPPLDAVLTRGVDDPATRYRVHRLLNNTLVHLQSESKVSRRSRAIAAGWLAEPRLAPFRDGLPEGDALGALWARIRAMAAR